MKEISILCVEDGSVDVESLENEGLHDGKVLIYRQGANPPFVLKLKTDDGELKSEQNKVAVEKLEELRARFDNSPNKQQKPIKHDSFLLSKIDRLEDKVIELQQQLKEMRGGN